MKKKKTDLTLIILNYNTRFWLKNLLDSLQVCLEKTKSEIEIVVVDNNSTDDSIKMLKENYRSIKQIELKQNKGFAAGNNVAIKQAKSRYIMLLNSDTECNQMTNFDELIAFMDAHKEIAVVTPKVVMNNGKIDPACHRGEPTPWASLTYFFKLEHFLPKIPLFSQYHQYYKDLDSIHDVDACSGAAMLVRMSAINKIGLLDEQFFMYAEDLDWCKRFRESGYRIIYYPAVQITHHKYKSGIQSNNKAKQSRTREYFYDTMLAFYDKHYKNKYPSFIRQLVAFGINLKRGVT